MSVKKIYQINTLPFLKQLGISTINEIPDCVIDSLKLKWGVDFVYLMSVWERTTIKNNPLDKNNEFLFGSNHDCTGLPWSVEDIVTSGFSVKSYFVPEDIGGNDGLLRFKERLNKRGMSLILDFVPNHTARDNPWVLEKPDFYVHESNRTISFGSDSFYAPWQDTAQLDYTNLDMRTAIIEEINSISSLCDGLRCDMAHLVTNDIFYKNWREKEISNNMENLSEFWKEVRDAVGKEFFLMAECYGGTEYSLIEQGFDAVYDKDNGFYDRLVSDLNNGGNLSSLQGHIYGCNRVNVLTHKGQAIYGDCLVRFLENHDEKRSANVFLDKLETAIKVLVEQFNEPHGYIMFYNGQFVGSKIHTPVQLCRFPDEQVDFEVLSLYERILGADNSGEWSRLKHSYPQESFFYKVINDLWVEGR